MLFYLLLDEFGKVHAFPSQKGVLKGQYEVLYPGIPLGIAQELLQKISAEPDSRTKKNKRSLLPGIFKGGQATKKPEDREDIRTLRESTKNKIIKYLHKNPYLVNQTWQWLNPRTLEESDKMEAAEYQDGQMEAMKGDFLAKTQGRILAKGDLQRLGQESGIPYSIILELCQETVIEGKGEWLAALLKNKQSWRCQRCGETEAEEWTSIYGRAATCPSCSSLGSLSSLNTLYRSLNHPSASYNNAGYLSTGHINTSHLSINYTITDSIDTSHISPSDIRESNLKIEKPEIMFSPRWELSQAQKLAAQEVLAFVKSEAPLTQGKPIPGKNFKQEILLWAACGAGKTEVCFPAAAWALNQNQKVLFAAPRQDVVWDVAPRLEGDFPNLSFGILTGTSPQRFTSAQFVLATTHQILRFNQAFDLIFLDEMDAFPYYDNEALAWGLEKALKPNGKMVYLTATPSAESLQKVKDGEMKLIRLPARHHRQPVPVPQWKRLTGDPDPKRSQIKKIAQGFYPWLEELGKTGPILFFAPLISWVNPWVELLKELLPQWSISGSYSSDPMRRVKIEELRKGSYELFVCTSILERGVTIPQAQVIVLGADHGIFDERSLVQMAGRVGRSREHPTGTALFLATQKTSAINKAITWIEEQNQLALEGGLLF